MKSKVLVCLLPLALASCGMWDKPFPDEADPYDANASLAQPNRQAQTRPKPKPTPQTVAPTPPPEPPKAKPEAGAYYEIGAASAPFHLTKAAASSSKIPDKLLTRRDVVKLTAPDAGGSLSKVQLPDGQVGYVPIASVRIVPPEERPSAPAAPTIEKLEVPKPLDDLGIDRPTPTPSPSTTTTPPPRSLPTPADLNIPDIPDPTSDLKIEDF